MPTEAVAYLNCRPERVYVDGTLGGAGHARLICDRIGPGGRLIGIDQDEAAISHGRMQLSTCSPRVDLFHDNFSNLPSILRTVGISGVDGILLDLGISQYHLASSGRGFSFQKDEPLDMRMDARSGLTAADLVNERSASDLERIFKTNGEERWARRIAGRIVSSRAMESIRTSKQLVQVVLDAVPAGYAARQRIHPATRVFMALRIAVNQELAELSRFLDTVLDILNPEGRLCILSFHSLEDRIVKRQFKTWAKGCTCPADFPICACGKSPVVRVLTPHVIRPTDVEVAANPLAGSTRLRAMERL